MPLILITGGARSGKSRFAYELAEKTEGEVTYIATAEAKDEHMKKRIEEHRKRRPSHWKLIEEPVYVERAIKKAERSDCVIIDCLTLLITNWLLSEGSEPEGSSCSSSIPGREKEPEITRKLEQVIREVRKLKGVAIIVSNEVGMGVVPEKKLGRTFRDIQGMVNQQVSSVADEVYFVVSGIPQRIK